MTKLRGLGALVLAAAVLGGCAPSDPPESLSAYGLFQGPPHEQRPAKGVLPYALNTPLFSDHASKHRFIQLPEGASMRYRAGETLEFPVGTVIAKTFSYPGLDGGPTQLMETRILRLGEEGWEAFPYVWNEQQTEATLQVIGAVRAVRFRSPDGEMLEHTYRVPNQNQCKGCHRRKDREMLPIGPTAAQLHRDYEEGVGRSGNQLADWTRGGQLQSAPALDEIERAAVWNDPATGSLDERARAWLDINCAHCHNPEGPARTSSLDLRAGHEDARALGVMKTPVAAGRGSGDRLYSIVPGDPEASILVYRMESRDPGAMMPELGRSLVDHEAVQLIRQWISEMSEG